MHFLGNWLSDIIIIIIIIKLNDASIFPENSVLTK